MKKSIFVLLVLSLFVISCKDNTAVTDEYILSVMEDYDTLYEEDGRPFGIRLLGVSEERLTKLLSLEVLAVETITTSGIQIRRTAIVNEVISLTFENGKCNRIMWNFLRSQSVLERAAFYSELKYEIRDSGFSENVYYTYYHVNKNKKIEMGILIGNNIQIALIQR